MERWTIWHLVLAILHTIAGVYVLWGLHDGIMKTEQPVYWTQGVADNTKNEFHVHLKKNHLFSISPIAIHAIISLATAVSHILASVFYKCEKDGVKNNRPNRLRWAEYSITATAITLSGYISVGQGDILILVIVIIMGFLLQACGYLMEKLATEKGQSWRFLVVGSFVELAIAIPLTSWTIGLDTRDNVGLYAALIAYIIYYALFPVNALWDLRKDKNGSLTTDFKDTDKRYVVLSFTSKMALFWITVGALMGNITDGTERDQWNNVVIAACTVPAGIVVAYAASPYISEYSYKEKDTTDTNNDPPGYEKIDPALKVENVNTNTLIF